MARGDLAGEINGMLLDAGEMTRFTGRFFQHAFRPRFEWRELVRQSFINGYRSLALVAITALIMGLVLTVRSRPTLARFGAEAMLPAMVAVSGGREIALVICRARSVRAWAQSWVQCGHRG